MFRATYHITPLLNLKLSHDKKAAILELVGHATDGHATEVYLSVEDLDSLAVAANIVAVNIIAAEIMREKPAD